MFDDKAVSEKPYQVVDLASLPGVPCPCGTARRAFADVSELPATIHLTEIQANAALHYHRHLTEIYYILECGPKTEMQLDDELIPLTPGRCIYIPPGVRHRVIGESRVLIVVLPKFDPEDEFIVTEAEQEHGSPK